MNLCSSAVLDRLNGLLEPNGVLSIPERGGSINEIRPHPDFRMFFTMDPRSGEISRYALKKYIFICYINSFASTHLQSINQCHQTIFAFNLSLLLSVLYSVSFRINEVCMSIHNLMMNIVSSKSW